MPEQDIEQLAINTVRALAMDAVEAANSGHPGMPMGTAPAAYVLFREAMRYDPADPAWPGRDRFVLSAGHGSMLLYSMLHLVGYDQPTLDDIRNFRQWGSPTPGHPENFLLPAVETTTGPLGQGVANGIGMAVAARRLGAEFAPELFDSRIYGIVSDGDLMEGVASEAASLAGHLQLGNIVYLYDDNQITIDGGTHLAFTEDVLARFQAYGWHTDRVEDANDLDSIRSAIKAAEADERPSLISVRTVIGYGSPNKAGTSAAHGSPLGADEVAASKANLGWPYAEPFTVPDAIRDHLDARDRGAAAHREWQGRFDAYREREPEKAAELDRRLAGELPEGWREALAGIDGDSATRKHSGKTINALAPIVPELFGGSADLAGSNNTDIDGGGDFSADNPGGRNVRFGVREHAMASVCNGMALYGGLIPYAATFLIFTDYCRPAIRLSALSELRVVWVMTHDSVFLGEDGPTHQPIEHVASLRAIPNLQVFRPATGQETAQSWGVALESPHTPSVIALTRQGLPDLGPIADDAVARGGYIIRDCDGSPDVILIATGSELHLCVGAAERLAADGVGARVVSMVCWERFADQPADYRDEVLPPAVTARVAVEAGTTFGWERWVGARGAMVGLDHFGASAPYERIAEEFGFTVDHVTEVARGLLST